MPSESSDFPPIPKEAIVRPEDERPVKRVLKPEEVESKEEKDYDKMKSVDYDMDGDGNPDFDPAL
jgi:hypothetical protein